MNERIQELVARFEQVNEALIEAVERCPAVQWQAPCPDDGRTAGVIAHHVASSYPAVVALIETAALGQPLPSLSQEMIDQLNAAHAQAHAACTPQETAALLRRNGQLVVEALRSLRASDLERETPSHGTTGLLIDGVLIGHAQRHLAGIQAIPGD